MIPETVGLDKRNGLLLPSTYLMLAWRTKVTTNKISPTNPEDPRWSTGRSVHIFQENRAEVICPSVIYLIELIESAAPYFEPDSVGHCLLIDQSGSARGQASQMCPSRQVLSIITDFALCINMGRYIFARQFHPYGVAPITAFSQARLTIGKAHRGQIREARGRALC